MACIIGLTFFNRPTAPSNATAAIVNPEMPFVTKSASQVPADPYRKAKFREIARSIVAKDRYNRKYGLAVDTAGAIAGALERAYRQGVAGSRPDRQPQSRNSELARSIGRSFRRGRARPSGAFAWQALAAMACAKTRAISCRQ
ncbi:hypothetical protein [Mesorhizobium sp.]|uniref:hypothetical protein n=1 Tax=Mesorhizobium sp. TaxID=1871066 RepID=UPI0025C6CA74|nr:hypothetical protein [Mesorhizobium sp.]